jgi:thiol-disulfide isomerase/thioredoxin
MDEERKIPSFTTPILVTLLVVASFLVGAFFTKIQYLEKGKTGTAQITPTPQVAGEKEPTEELPTTIGGFLVTKNEVCKENDKPLVYFFGSSTCPHCTWEKPVMQRVAPKFAGHISYHENFDSQEDKDVLEQFRDINPGYVPFLVFGCKYVRVGSGETAGEAEEKKNLTALICKLTDGKPAEVCQKVADLTEQIK